MISVFHTVFLHKSKIVDQSFNYQIITRQRNFQNDILPSVNIFNNNENIVSFSRNLVRTNL